MAVKKNKTIYHDVAYDFLFHLIISVSMKNNHEYNEYDYYINHIKLGSEIFFCIVVIIILLCSFSGKLE